MARGKRSKGKNYISKGQRPNVTRSLVKAGRREYTAVDNFASLLNKQKAWRAGKNVVLTVANPDKKNTKERFIKISANDYWGYPRGLQLKMR